ncbi:hypothetical protein Tco_0400210 [Tanacetum coccineum]
MMLTVSIEDAHLKFLRSLPSVWHVVATMIRGQPGLDELDFDDLYNNLKVYEHELKGVSNSNSQNIAFLSTEVKGKCKLLPNCASYSDESYVPFCSTKHLCPQLMMMKTWLQNDEEDVAIEDSNSKALVATDNNEDIDWTKEFDAEPVTYAMMALTGVEQDDWSMEFDAEHVHFGQDGLGDFDWSNKDDDTPVSLALMATNSEVPYCSKCSKSYKLLLENYQKERDNFQRARTEILGYQMSLESLEVMLKTHEKNEYAWGDKYEQMEYDLKIRDLKLEEKQKELDQALKERDDFKVKLEKWSNASVLQNEVLNKQRYVSDKSCIGFGIESSNSMESDISSGDETLTDSAYENFKREKAYKAVPPPTGTIIPPRANVSFTGIDELAIRNKVVNQEKTKSSQSAIDRNKVIIEDWVDSDDEETDVSESQKETAFNSENSETSFESRSPNSQNSVGQESRTRGRVYDKSKIKLGNQKGNYRDSVHRGIGSYTLKQFEQSEEDLKTIAIIDSGCYGQYDRRTRNRCLILKIPKLPEGMMSTAWSKKNLFPSGGITCFVAKATDDESFSYGTGKNGGHVGHKSEDQSGLHSKNGVGSEDRIQDFIEAARTLVSRILIPINFGLKQSDTACIVLISVGD